MADQQSRHRYSKQARHLCKIAFHEIFKRRSLNQKNFCKLQNNITDLYGCYTYIPWDQGELVVFMQVSVLPRVGMDGLKSASDHSVADG